MPASPRYLYLSKSEKPQNRRTDELINRRTDQLIKCFSLSNNKQVMVDKFSLESGVLSPEMRNSK